MAPELSDSSADAFDLHGMIALQPQALLTHNQTAAHTAAVMDTYLQYMTGLCTGKDTYSICNNTCVDMYSHSQMAERLPVHTDDLVHFSSVGDALLLLLSQSPCPQLLQHSQGSCIQFRVIWRSGV